VVDNGVGVGLGAGREHDDLEMQTQSSQDFPAVRSHLNESVTHPSLDRTEGHSDLVVGSGELVGVDQGLVHVEHDGLAALQLGRNARVQRLGGGCFTRTEQLFECDD
jgi:hypothetical protein